MKLSSSLEAATTWIKFHQASFFLGLSLVIACAVAVVYYMNPSHPASRAVSEGVKTTPPAVLVPVRSDTSIMTTEVQSATINQPAPAVNTRVHVNGQQVSVPKTGTVHKVIKDDNGVTTVDVSINANSSGSSTSYSSTNIELDSTTEHSSYTESSQ